MVGHRLEMQLHLILAVVGRILLSITEKPECEKAFHMFHVVSSFFFIAWLALLLHFAVLCLLV